MENLHISGLQYDIIWESPEQNLQYLEEILLSSLSSSDIMILPEMFTTGFTMNAQNYAETMDGPVVKWLSKMAKLHNCHMAGTLAIKINNSSETYANRLIWSMPDGQIKWYDKHHLFSVGGEHKIYTPGNNHLTITVKGWRIRPFICYDIRFPTWTRNTKPYYDVSIFIANWPSKRAHHWKTLLTARAIENQSYVVGINRIGVDGRNILYQGDSMIIDPQGQTVINAGKSSKIISHSMSYDSIQNWREVFPVLEDQKP